MIKPYAFIKNNIVQDVLLFDDPSEELLESFRVSHNVDIVIEANERCGIGGQWNGTNFIPLQPYPSWVDYDEELGAWFAPVPAPPISTNTQYLVWDEPTLSWIVMDKED